MKDLITVLLSWLISAGILLGSSLAYYFAICLSILSVMIFLILLLTTTVMTTTELHTYYNSLKKIFTKKWLASFLLTVPLYLYATISTGSLILVGLLASTWVVFLIMVLTLKYLSSKKGTI